MKQLEPGLVPDMKRQMFALQRQTLVFFFVKMKWVEV